MLAASLWWTVGRRGKDAAEEKDPEPTAQVETAPLHRGVLERRLVAYGTVIAPPGATRTVTLPFECRVISVATSSGQRVKAGDPVLQVEQSTDAQAVFSTAESAAAAAGQALHDTQRRFQDHLATNQDLLAAQGAARDAQIKLESLQKQSSLADGILRAPFAGVITRIAVQPGAIVPVGGVLAEVATSDDLEARLGIAPADAAEVRPGQEVHISPVETGSTASFSGQVRTIGQSIDPSTRLVDAFVTLHPAGSTPPAMLIGSFLRAEVVTEKKEALLSPRAAVLLEPDGKSGVIYTIKEGHASKHVVNTGLDDGEQVEITGTDGAVSSGLEVVTTGVDELEDGMAVERAGKARAEP